MPKYIEDLIMPKYMEDALNRAKTEIEEVIKDDSKFELFKKQVSFRLGKNCGFVDSYREKLLDERLSESGKKELLSILALFYQLYSMTFICDFCEYKPRHRKYGRQFSTPKKFNCEFDEKNIITDSKVPPEFLNVEENLCPHHYIDYSKP